LGENWVKASAALEAHGEKAPRILPDARGNLLAPGEKADSFWRLTTFLEGSSPPPGDLAAARGAGRALGAAHWALNTPRPLELLALPPGDFTNQKLPTPEDFADFPTRYARHPALHLLKDDWERGAEAARRLPASPQYRRVFFARDLVIHGDPKKDNFLGNGREYSLIDWDTVSYGDPLIDLGEICRSMAARRERPFFAGESASALAAGYRERGLALGSASFRLLPAVIRGLSLNLARRYLSDALLESYFIWDKEAYPSLFAQNRARAEALMDLAEELWEREMELLDL
jgi:Ser/Thr protein kinase RdoA (MazF antagonist)